MWIVNVRYADGTTARRPCAGNEGDAYRYAAWLAGQGEGVSCPCEHEGIVGPQVDREQALSYAYLYSDHSAPPV